MTAPYRSLPATKSPAESAGVAPAVVLHDPRYARNVGVAVRAASCYGLGQVWFTGERVSLDLHNRTRLPREERMKGYRDVDIVHCDLPLEQFPRHVTPVAVEVREASERLFDFEHPEHAVYVFGPEDGSLPPSILRHCHRFVVIPARHCLNLAVAVGTVLYDRAAKQARSGVDGATLTPGQFERRGGLSDWEELLVQDARSRARS